MTGERRRRPEGQRETSETGVVEAGRGPEGRDTPQAGARGRSPEPAARRDDEAPAPAPDPDDLDRRERHQSPRRKAAGPTRAPRRRPDVTIEDEDQRSPGLRTDVAAPEPTDPA
jgi:hypothetical protein